MQVANARGPAFGVRRLTAEILDNAQKLAHYDGLPQTIGEDGLPVTVGKSELLSAFKKAAPYIGVDETMVIFIDLLMGFSQEQDWLGFNRPIIWPSNEKLVYCTGKSLSAVKARIRKALELGLILERSSSNGKRYGYRSNKTGQIIEAYGFDLSPLANRFEEFSTAAENSLAFWADKRRIRMRATAIRRSIRQCEDLAYDQDLLFDDELKELLRGADQQFEFIQGFKASPGSEGLQMLSELVDTYQSIADQISSWLQQATTIEKPVDNEDNIENIVDKKIDINPKKSENEPHNTPTKPLSLPKGNYISSHVDEKGIAQKRDKLISNEDGKRIVCNVSSSASENPPIIDVDPHDLINISPLFATMLMNKPVSWDRLVRLAGPIKDMLGISNHAWNKALKVMSIREAVCCLAVIDAKKPENIAALSAGAGRIVPVNNPGGCFVGMTSSAGRNELNLQGSVWYLTSLKKKATN